MTAEWTESLQGGLRSASENISLCNQAKHLYESVK